MEIRADRLFLFLWAVRTPARTDVVKAMRPSALILPSRLSAERIRELVEQEVNWVSVHLDVALDVLSDVLVENLDRIGPMVLNGAPVHGYIEATYPVLLPLLARIASGEITEEMLKESEAATAPTM